MAGYIPWLRSLIGHRKTILAYATALIRDNRGHLLFQRRTDFAWWGLPGGALELGETFTECVVREAAEETGLRVQPVRLVGLYASPVWDFLYPNGDEVQQFTVAIECRVVGGCSQPDGQETIAHQFFPLENAPMDCPPWYVAMIGDVQKNQSAHFDVPFTAGHAASVVLYEQNKRKYEEGTSRVEHWWSLRQMIGCHRVIVMGAGSVIQDASGRVLLGLRADSGEWGLPGGLMELGETPAGTAVREADEEMHIHIHPTQLIGVFTGPTFFHTYRDGNEVQIVSAFFRAELQAGLPTPDGVETLAVAWFDPVSLPPMVRRHRYLLDIALANPHGGQFA
jgi:ADP-ribose pyrophosphatase YjhB (NUDIX family)